MKQLCVCFLLDEGKHFGNICTFNPSHPNDLSLLKESVELIGKYLDSINFGVNPNEVFLFSPSHEHDHWRSIKLQIYSMTAKYVWIYCNFVHVLMDGNYAVNDPLYETLFMCKKHTAFSNLFFCDVSLDKLISKSCMTVFSMLPI